ncbi:MAG: hypothetical protein J6S21_05175, partial [Victivallales bacterium]|nr:hypothetical protein [Victivallales bacterium]
MFKKVFGFFLLSVLSLSLLSAGEISTKGWCDSYVVPTVRLNAADGDLEVTAPEKFPVSYGGMVTFEVSGSGSGAMEMVLLVYDKDGNHIHTFSRQRGIPRNNAAISMKLRVDGGWKGAAPAYGAVALRLAKGASMEVTGTKITYEDKPAVAATTRALRRPETGAQNVDKILTREAARVRNPQ